MHSIKNFTQSKPLFVKSFIKGIVTCVIIFFGFGLWIFLNADKTNQNIQKLIPTKTAVLELPQVEQALEKNTPAVKLSQEKEISSLPPAPIDGFTVDENGKILPTKNAEGVTPFDAYKRPFVKTEGYANVSIVVVDYGLSEKTSQTMVNNLPAEISFVLNPYADDITKWAAAARSFGHEFWLSLPIQANNLNLDMGNLSLSKNAVPEQNDERYKHILGITSGYVGFVTTPDHDLEKNISHIKNILDDTTKRGLGFVEINERNDISAMVGLLKDNPYVGQNDFWLDGDLTPESLESAFINIEQKAKRDGHVIVFTHPYPSVLNAILKWSKDLKSKDIQLAPLSASIKP